MRSLSVAATGMMAQQLNVEVISNNIANMNTTGFKRQRPEFQDLLYQSLRRIGATTSSQGTVVPGVQLGLGVKAAASTASTSRATRQHRQPARPRDPGPGLLPGRPRTARPSTPAGNFQLSPRARSSPRTATRSHPGSPSRRTPPRLSIDAQGNVTAKVQGQTALAASGPAPARELRQRGRARAPGNNLLRETDASGQAQWPRPAPRGWGRCSRATSRARTSTRCRRSPR